MDATSFLHQVPAGYAAFWIYLAGLFEYLRFTHVMNPLPCDAAHHVLHVLFLFILYQYVSTRACLFVCVCVVCVCVCLLYTSVVRLYFSAITHVNLYMLGEELNKQYAFVLILKICML